MSKIHEIDGVKYREIDRKAEVGEKVVITKDEMFHGLIIGKVYNVERMSENSVMVDGMYLETEDDEIRDYVILEPITETNETTPEHSSYDRILEMLVNLAQKVTELERQLSETDDKAEMALDDIVTLDDRTQVLNETISSQELDDYMRGYNDGFNHAISLTVKGGR